MTYLQFDFHKKTKIFASPDRIIQAYTIEDVIPALTEVQEAVHLGYYAAGYLSYESAPAFENVMVAHSNNKMPLLWFGIYSEVKMGSKYHKMDSFHKSNWYMDTEKHHYDNAIKFIKNQIELGNTYQVNYTIRMHSEFKGDPFSYYQQLANSQSAYYSAYLDLGEHKILSASPELFFHLKEGKIKTKPMKGTIARGKSDMEDQENSRWLYHSEKNRAENVMIVDLLRNDLGIISKPGSVKVPELFSIEQYPTVYQMTSTVTGEIADNKDIVDIFKALFPCGSITGAPKINTMKIINQLETSPREVYCGAIGYITPDQEAIFNVPIRTVIIGEDGKASYGVGGGITWDSDAEDEYHEVLTKAKILSNSRKEFQLIETIGLKSGKLIVLDEHLERLKNSANYFGFKVDVNKLRYDLLRLGEQHSEGDGKIRVLLDSNGNIVKEVLPLQPISIEKQKVSLAKIPVCKQDIFLYHKTTNRAVYEQRLQESPDVFDVLLWNEQEEVTEFTRGNIVVELDGERYTPPVSSGLLAGTYRKSLLQQGKIKERIIPKNQLPRYDRIWFINSVREWIEVEFI
ncbi:aminodeoxychorismate synthase component I [Ornithinibacillus scapharcae]|uniref:aminodeoxychorismate synthase component I n=1 Tax=Ornithinibacillus scapharcae TaxID=1147159 RepID=UPI000225B89D|nr:aminodeoxychorismate synthase component I [Ornithinibacillus scapharcae]